jgi:tetraacyldisaccharide 4'-kinase
MDAFRILLLPVSLLYGGVTWVRNKCFDWGILSSQVFDHPIISVGNLSMGGTGKTPHIEYLISLLKKKYQLAILSRGYMRKTKGYQVVGKKSDVSQAGDEPLQIFRKHPDTKVAVCEDRRTGIKMILKESPGNKVILLDDAFQHRYVKPGLNIMLTDYHKIFTKNFMLPTGNLREFKGGAKRADALIVTKTPTVFSPLDRKIILKDLNKYNIRNIYFSFIKYGDWIPFTEAARIQKCQKAKTIFLLTGIANPTPLAEHLKRLCIDLKIFKFSDHHQFSEKEILNVIATYTETFGKNKVIITTEKDSMRLDNPLLKPLLNNLPLYYVPIEIDFHEDDKEKFDKLVFNYIENHKPGTPKPKQHNKSIRNNPVKKKL